MPDKVHRSGDGATGPGVEAYLQGQRLWGDDLPPEEVEAWVREEADAYARLVAMGEEEYRYAYHALNRLLGFRHLPSGCRTVLALGGARGDELRPIADVIRRAVIVEPAAALRGADLPGVDVTYVPPTPTGDLPFRGGAFDLVTCLGVLHHVPNVSHVAAELYRVLRPGGRALVREPIVSMGDWRQPRPGLTRRERGIPLDIFREILAGAGFRTVQERLLGFPLIPRLAVAFGTLAYNHPWLVRLDLAVSRIARLNYRYHADHVLQKLRPTMAYYVLER